jgi:EmrB/QacA subfamily drug resistance transporter
VTADGAGSVATLRPANPWRVLCATLPGFLMVALDASIMGVANPVIMLKLSTNYDMVIWATSAYLLAYAVPLLLAGSLGDRFGQKNIYLIGLTLFTAASLWCGLSTSIQMLIAARVAQGLGGALIMPQAIALVARIFPPDRRGVAISVLGMISGLGSLLGPVVGGLLVDGLGWQSIFLVNIPLGVIALGLAMKVVPTLPTHEHAPDILGAALSGVGLFLVVFGLQAAQSHHWSWDIWAMISAGLAAFVVFIYWQATTTREPLVPLAIFRDRNFSVAALCTVFIAFIAIALRLVINFYTQSVCGLTVTEAGLFVMSASLAMILVAPFAGKLIDTVHPGVMIGFGFGLLAVGAAWLSIEMMPTTPIWRLLLPFVAIGVALGLVWSPLVTTATRELPAHMVGIGSGVYNALQQVGFVVGSAGMAAFMTGRIGAKVPGLADRGGLHQGTTVELPSAMRDGFAAAMSQSMNLITIVALLGLAGAVFLRRYRIQASSC